ncbi:MAG: hypothetical protein QXV32_02405 [Conexivisphaerales archaeon]
MASEEQRDRELENILGQFLVSSFQSEKLAEMIHEKLSFRPNREIKFYLPGRQGLRAPYMITIKIEPFSPQQLKKEEIRAGEVKALCILESPSLDIDVSVLRESILEIVNGSLEWWTHQGTHRDLKLSDWRTNVAIIDSKDSKKIASLYASLNKLEAKRKGEMTR